ncbi:ectin-like [Cimex lectularius]|uniref:SCP domain-containing protein n=1 Tax=Cimex lectularius TaxID=79782 RepID=A0A8I6RBY6_CIMLE|nr:ectin-like [Cimex lectularius]
MNRSKKKGISARVRFPLSEPDMFRIPSLMAMNSKTKSTARSQERKDSVSVKNTSFELVKQPRMNSTDMKRFCAANMDVLQATSYFPKPRAVANRMLDYKSPERLVGIHEKRTCNAFDLVDISAPESVSSSVDMTPFQAEMLSIHNKLRLSHNAPSLKLDKDLCLIAMKRAAFLAASGKQDEAEDEGRNVFVFTKLKRPTEAREACESWYKEGKKYQYDVQKNFNAHNRHFTQMIWAETSLLGAGMAKGNGKTYIVAIYVPKGNVSGKYSFNVFKPSSSEKVLFN